MYRQEYPTASKWDHRYRRLEEGEIVLPSDELLDDRTNSWVYPRYSIGKPAPDPSYTSHRTFRRYVGWHRFFLMQLNLIYSKLRIIWWRYTQ